MELKGLGTRIATGFPWLAVGIVLGSTGFALLHTHFQDLHTLEIRAKHAGKTLTNPLLECREFSEQTSDGLLAGIRSDVVSLIDASRKKGDISYASVYFRDLNNGPWFGVNESDEFFPASLLKLPLAISFYNIAEDEPQIMDKKVIYTPTNDVEKQIQPFGPARNVESGHEYSVKELIDIMLKESSNEAAVTLASLLTSDQITSVYEGLGLRVPVFGRDYKIDTHKYGIIFPHSL